MKKEQEFYLKPEIIKDKKLNDKVEWIALSHKFLKNIINKGKLQGFDKRDYGLLKLINTGYIRAYKNIKHPDCWNFLMMTDDLVKGVSDKAYKRLQEMYLEYN